MGGPRGREHGRKENDSRVGEDRVTGMVISDVGRRVAMRSRSGHGRKGGRGEGEDEGRGGNEGDRSHPVTRSTPPSTRLMPRR
jgi:hypothetical protein